MKPKMLTGKTLKVTIDGKEIPPCENVTYKVKLTREEKKQRKLKKQERKDRKEKQIESQRKYNGYYRQSGEYLHKKMIARNDRLIERDRLELERRIIKQARRRRYRGETMEDAIKRIASNMGLNLG